MNKLWTLIGRILFWLLWPVLYVYLRVGKRSRVIVTSKGRILLVKGWIGSGHWILPGGGIHASETKEQGAIREVFEETGVKLEIGQLEIVGGGTADEYGLTYEYVTFWVDIERAQKPVRQKWELVDAAWLPLSGILQRTDISPETRRILSSWRGKG